MSTFISPNVSSVFPPTTTVKAYATKGAQPIAPSSGPPPGPVIAEAEVTAEGKLELTGLVESTFYLLYAEVSAVARYLHIYIERAGEVTVIATQATGDFAITTAGKGLKIKEGANAKMGSSTLVAGKVTVANKAVTAESRIFLQSKGAKGEHIGALTVTAKVAATSFTVESSNAEDAREFDYVIFEPA
jgi:hypothetical protein